MENLTVTATPANDETFARALGITKKREAEIDVLVDECHQATDTYPDAIARISTSLKTANELAYASFHLGAFAESQRTRHQLLHKLLIEDKQLQD